MSFIISWPSFFLPGCQAACLLFFACGKVNPWASISTNNLSNIKTFNTTNDNGAERRATQLSDLVPSAQRASENFFFLFFLLLQPNLCFFVMSYATFEPARPLAPRSPIPLPSFPLRSAQVIMLLIECRAPEAEELPESEYDCDSRRFPCSCHIVKQIDAGQRRHMVSRFSFVSAQTVDCSGINLFGQRCPH